MKIAIKRCPPLSGRRRGGAAGFTLVEVLVALVVLALIALAAYRSLDSVLATQDRLSRETRKWQRLNLFFGSVEQDVAEAIPRPVVNSAGLVEPEWLGLNAPGSGVPQLAFTRNGLPDQAGRRHEPKRIGYLFETDALYLLRWPSLDQAAEVEPTRYRLIDGVKQVRWRYLASNGQWLSAWPTAGQTSLPRAVEVGLTLSSGESVTRIFSLR